MVWFWYVVVLHGWNWIGTAVRCAMHTVHAVFFQFERRRDSGSGGSGVGGRIAGDHYLHNTAGSTHLLASG